MIIGLGNPGKKYAQTRHNLGFMVLDELALRHNLQFKTGRGAYLESRMSSGSLLIKPMTYMNLSGQAVQDLCRRYTIDQDQMLIVHDDLDVDFGRIKIRPGGSDGGHNGLKSVFNAMGSQDIPRLKIGINTPDRRSMDAEVYVLKPFFSHEKTVLKEILRKAADAVELFLDKDLNTVMNQYNRYDKNDSDDSSNELSREIIE